MDLLKVRTDALPEATDYSDDGCDIAPSCLNCPLPQCRYDLPMTMQKSRERAVAARSLFDVGFGAPMVAQQVGVTTRQAYRYARAQ